MKTKRNSNVELLRIFSMILIVLGHTFGTRFEGTNQPTTVFLEYVVFASWAILGVDLFVIISAWFLCEQKFKTSRIVSVLFEALCYILAFDIAYAVIILYKTRSVPFAIRQAVLFLFDGVFSQYHWFVGAYIIMCFASPLINRLIQAIDRQLLKVIIIIGTAAVIYQNFTGAGYYSFFADSANFIYIYLLVGYIKKYGFEFKKPLFLSIIITAGMIIGNIALRFIKNDDISHYAYKLIEVTVANTKRYSPLIILLALCIFMFVIRIKERHSNFVNLVAGTTFGIYLFHETYIPVPYSFISTATQAVETKNASALKDFAVTFFYNIGLISPGFLLALQMIMVSILIFACGAVVENLRNRFIQKPFMKWADARFGEKFNRIDGLINNKKDIL